MARLNLVLHSVINIVPAEKFTRRGSGLNESNTIKLIVGKQNGDERKPVPPYITLTK